MAMPAACRRRQTVLFFFNVAVRRIAASSIGVLTGENCTPVAARAARATGEASMIVSFRPPTRATTGTAP